MQFKYFRFLKPTAIIVLLFFSWTFGGVFDITYAATNSENAGVKNKKSEKPEEKFNKTLDGIKAILEDTAIDTDTKYIQKY